MENLQQIPAFKSSPELIKKLYENSIKKSYKAGSVILKENAYTLSIPVVTKGILKIVRRENEDKAILLYYVKKGETCILPFWGSIYNITSSLRVEAEEDSEIYFLPIQKARLFIKEHPQWLDYILLLFIKHYEDLINVVDYAYKKTDERLLYLLKNKAEVSRSRVIPITHKQLAYELLTSRVVISRLLKQLEEKGVLKLNRNQITLI